MTVYESKSKKEINGLLARQNYLVTQANDLAKSFGNLSAFENKLLDYCFSYVKKDDKPSPIYKANALDILKHLKLSSSGQSYKQVYDAFENLNKNTGLYLKEFDENGNIELHLTNLFSDIWLNEKGRVRFKFSEGAAPYIFELKDHFFSFKLSELANIKSKYAYILMKLWESKRYKPKDQKYVKYNSDKIDTTIFNLSVDEWRKIFFGPNYESKKYSASEMKRACFDKALKELGNNFPNATFHLETIKSGRKIIAFSLTITGSPHGNA